MTKDEIQRAVTKLDGLLDYMIACEVLCDSVRDGVDAIRAALQSALDGAGVPDGWQLVPKEPTTEILKTMCNFDDEAPWRDLWDAILEAAPKPALDKAVAPVVQNGYSGAMCSANALRPFRFVEVDFNKDRS